MIYILHGADDYTRDKALAEIKERLGDPSLASLNTTVLAGQKLAPEQLRGVCEVYPFFVRQRLVIVEGLLKRFSPRTRVAAGDRGAFGDQPKRRPAEGEAAPSGDGKDASSWQAYAECLSEAPTTTVVVLVESEEIKNDNPLLRALRPGAEVRRFAAPQGPELERWIMERARSAGGNVQSAAVRLLAELVGGNLRVLSSELEKLITYAGGRAVTERDVRALVSAARLSTVFMLVDALAERRTPRAIRLLHELLDDGEPPLRILTMITRQFRLLLQCRALRQQGEPLEVIRKTTGLHQEFALTKTLRQSDHYSVDQLKLIYARLLQTDVEIKTGRLEATSALDVLVADLARLGAPGAGSRVPSRGS